MARDLPLGRIPFGAVYLIDAQLTRAEKRRDLTRMRSLHFNTVVVWPPVSLWDGDPPGQTAFRSIDEVLDICAELGLKVILELQGQNTSQQEAPELFGVTANKMHLNQPAYRRLVEHYLREVAEHFRGHPALLAYDLYNEVGGFHDTDPWTIAEFVGFLETRYGHDIQALNRAWGTYFADFASIQQMPPKFNEQYDLWYSVVPQLDWLRFRSQNWAQRLAGWGAIIRSVDPEAVLLADVLGNDTLHDRADAYYGATDWAVAEQVDVLGLSCWANMLDRHWEQVDAFKWPQFWRAAQSASRGKQVIISELMTPNRTFFPSERSSMTDQIRLWSLQAIFHGLKGLFYWQYRPFRRGLQVAGRGLTDFAGEPTDQAAQTAEVAAFVERHAALLARLHPDSAGCAILHDQNAHDLYSIIHPGDHYLRAHAGMFRGFWEHGICPAYVIPDDLAPSVPAWIRVLAVPCNVSVSAHTATALIDFMQRGGVLLTESRFGLVDENGNLWPEVPGGELAAAVGIHESGFTCLFNGTVTEERDTFQLREEYYQFLQLEQPVNVTLRTTSGEVLLVESRVGAGLYIHSPLILTHLLDSERPAALFIFRQLLRRVQAALSPKLALLDKPPLVDISVLLDEQDQPALLGITNFGHSPVTLQMSWDLPLPTIGVGTGCALNLSKGQLTVMVPARQAAGLIVL